MTENFQILDKYDGNSYGLILVRDIHQSIGLKFLNGALDFIWNEVQVTMVGMGYWNDIIIYDYQWYRSM